MSQKVEGIFIHKQKYSDSRFIARFYTKEQGAMTFMCRGLKAPKGKASLYARLSPLSRVEVMFRYKEGRGMQSAQQIELSSPLTSLPFDMEKGTIAMFLVEVLSKTLREEEPNASMYTFVDQSIAYYDGYVESDNDFHLRFLAQLSRFLGFIPSDHYRPGDFFDIEEGIFTSLMPGHSRFLNVADSRLFHALMKQSVIDPARGFNTSERRALLDALMGLYGCHVPQFGAVKSLSVLREVFDA